MVPTFDGPRVPALEPGAPSREAAARETLEPASSPYHRMSQLARANRPFAVATVVRTHGSTPQTIGAKLVVSDDATERPFGTLGGGCVEADAIDAAREAL